MAINLERAWQLAGNKVIFDKVGPDKIGTITAYNNTNRSVLVSYENYGTFNITDTPFIRLLPYNSYRDNIIHRGFWCQYESDLKFVEDPVSTGPREKFYFLENDTITKEWVPCRLVSDRSRVIYLKDVPDNTKFEFYNHKSVWTETQKIPTKIVKFEIRLEVRTDRDVIPNIRETLERAVANMAAFDTATNKGACDYMIREIQAPNEKPKEEIKAPIIINNLEIT